MMRFTYVYLSALFAFGSTIALAQTAPVPAITAPPAATVAPSVTTAPSSAVATTKDGKPKAKEVRAACKAEAGTKNLSKGEAYKAFMRECIGKQRPDLVKSFDCRKESKEKKLEKEARKAFMKECRAKP